MDEIQIDSKHIFEGGKNSNVYFFEIALSHVDLLPSRKHIFQNSVFSKRRIIAEIVVAFVPSCDTLNVYIRSVEMVYFLLILTI
jgi:hypothetical protein